MSYTTVSLPAGTYRFDFAYDGCVPSWSSNTSVVFTNVTASIGDQTRELTACGSWSTCVAVSVTEISLAESGPLTFRIDIKNGTNAQWIGAGRFRLYWQGTEASFQAAQASMVNRDALWSALAFANALADGASISDEGYAFAYPTAAVNTFRSAIASTQAVCDAESTQSQVDAATQELSNATTTFRAAMNSPSALPTSNVSPITSSERASVTEIDNGQATSSNFSLFTLSLFT